MLRVPSSFRLTLSCGVTLTFNVRDHQLTGRPADVRPPARLDHQQAGIIKVELVLRFGVARIHGHRRNAAQRHGEQQLHDLGAVRQHERNSLRARDADSRELVHGTGPLAACDAAIRASGQIGAGLGLPSRKIAGNGSGINGVAPVTEPPHTRFPGAGVSGAPPLTGHLGRAAPG